LPAPPPPAPFFSSPPSQFTVCYLSISSLHSAPLFMLHVSPCFSRMRPQQPSLPFRSLASHLLGNFPLSCSRAGHHHPASSHS
jgi:hypothetical protein